MRILYHHRTVAQDGQHVHITELVSALEAQGHEVVMVAPRPATQGTRALGEDDGLVTILKRHLPRALYEVLEFGYSLLAFGRLWAAARRHRPDVLYERYNLYLLAGRWLKAVTGLPYLVEVNAPLLHERSKFRDGIALPWLAAWTERAVWRAADRVLPVTDALADFVRAAGVPEARIRVIPNGIDPVRFPPPDPATARAAGGPVVLGFTGIVQDWHGLEHVVDAVADDGGRHDLRLVVVGDGPALPDLRARAAARGVSERVELLGIVPRDRVAEQVRRFDIALQPRVTPYASPLKLFEYMALGRAIVAPDQPNIREVLIHGENALLFDPAAADGLADAIRTLVADPDLRARLGAAALDTIRTRDLTWAGNARRVTALAREVKAGA